MVLVFLVRPWSLVLRPSLVLDATMDIVSGSVFVDTVSRRRMRQGSSRWLDVAHDGSAPSFGRKRSGWSRRPRAPLGTIAQQLRDWERDVVSLGRRRRGHNPGNRSQKMNEGELTRLAGREDAAITHGARPPKEATAFFARHSE